MKSQAPSQQAAAGAPYDDAPAGEDRLWLSALADGDAEAVHKACALWRGDADARRSWHRYHLIGDVLRSDELAGSPERDAAFLQGLRARLAQEPVIVMPADAGVLLRGMDKPVRQRQRWLLPMAAAAGFVAVAGVLVVMRMSGGETQAGWASLGGTLSGTSAPGVTLVGNGTPHSASALPGAAGAVVIRDPRLDEFLRAHQSARGGMAVAAPGGALRRVEPVGNPVAER